MARLAEAADSTQGLAGLAVLLLLVTGARVSELASVRLGDVDPDRGTIRIVGKGDRERQVFVPDGRVSDLLRGHVEARSALAVPEGALLVGARGRDATAAMIRERVKRLCTRASRGEDYHIRRPRHPGTKDAPLLDARGQRLCVGRSLL